jgi:hypothetical protein
MINFGEKSFQDKHFSPIKNQDFFISITWHFISINDRL